MLLSSRPSAGALLNLLDAALSAIASASLPPTTQRGTTSSNPSPSSGESGANSTERRDLIFLVSRARETKKTQCLTALDQLLGIAVTSHILVEQKILERLAEGGIVGNPFVQVEIGFDDLCAQLSQIIGPPLAWLVDSCIHPWGVRQRQRFLRTDCSGAVTLLQPAA